MASLAKEYGKPGLCGALMKQDKEAVRGNMVVAKRRYLAWILSVLLMGTGSLRLCGADVVINEFMADNDSTLLDGDGNASDWIELHNTSSSEVDLTGWYLTDDAGNLRQWQFPATSISGDGYLVVFASGQEVDDYVDSLGYLHTNFKLSRNDDNEHESVVLVMPDGATIADAYLDYPEQSKDVSYGLAQEMEFTTLVAEEDDAIALIPEGPVADWTDVDFDDSGWPLTGRTGVGYEGNSGYEQLIHLDVTAMRGENTSVYIRIEFEISDPLVFDLLTLRMKYDDGFVAYLNGTQVAAPNAPASPEWNSQATSGHEASVAEYEDLDVTEFVTALRAGKNVLAIHGLNNSLTSSDMLILPELIAVDLSGPQQGTAMFLATPTPRHQNVTGVLGYLTDIRFSVDRGFFTDPFDVVITTATEDAEIYYTLNGSQPTPDTGILYTGAITISSTTVLRAAAFKAGYQPSKTETETYMFLNDVIVQDGFGLPNTWGHAGADYDMDPEVVSAYSDTIVDDLKSVPSLSLAMDMDDFFGAGGVGIYPSGEGSPRATSLELIDPADETEFQIDCSVEVCGGTSTNRWKSDKLSMRLRFKEPYGPTKLRFPLFGEDAADRFDTLILDARLNQAWAYGGGSSPDSQRRLAQYTRDQYPADLQNALGGYGPRGMAIHLYINGVYWGLYLLHERPDESFAAAYFGGDRDDYDVLKHNQSTVVHGSNADYRAMVQLAGSGLSGDAQYQQMQGYLDVPNFIDYIIVNFFIGNTDWAHQNWYATRNVVNPDGRWRYHSWDPEHSLKGLYDNVTSRDDYGGPTGLHHDLCGNAEYRLLFADHVHKHFFNDGALTTENAAAAYGKLLDEVDRAVVGESARWGDNQRPDDPYTRDDEWVTERDRLLNEYFPQRTSIVLGQLRNRGLYPSLEAPTFGQHGGSFASGFTLSMSASAPVYYTLDGTDPRECGTGRAVGNLYGWPIILERTVLVKARAMASESNWSALNEALFVLDTPSPLRVTEIMYHSRAPSGPEADGNRNTQDFDFIEVRNTGSSAIGLAGIKFTDGIAFDFAESGTHSLAPGEYAVLVKNTAAFSDRYPNWAEMNIAGEFKYPADSLANEGERLALKDGLGRTILSFEYDDDWYPNTDGLGFSLVVLNEGAPSNTWGRKMSWRASTNIDGSPGQDDPSPPETPAVVINEALTHAVPPAKDAIELYNPSANRAEIGGWFLTDDRTEPRKFRVPDGTEIPVGGYLVFDEDDFNSDPASPTSFLLSSLGEDVYLFSADPEGTLTGYVHGFRFGAAENGVTFGRYVTSTGEDHFVAQVTPTLTVSNAGPEVWPVVINEIMFNPLPAAGTNSGILEYLELRNISSQPVLLFDPDAPENTWRIGGGVDYCFPTNTTILPGSCVVVVSFDPETDTAKLEAFRSRYNPDPSVEFFGPYSGRLENSGESVMLLKPDAPKEPPDPDAGCVPYVLVDEVDYSNSDPWPTGADGTGDSLQRVFSGEYGNDPVNWKVAPPTPGQDNGGSGVEDADGDGMPDEWEQIIVDFDPGDEVDNILKVEGEDDFDEDGASNFSEYEAGSNPVDRDSDDDGYTDGDELSDSQSDPLNADSTPPDNDGDFVSDLNDPDDDNDGYADDDELTESQSDPLDADSTPPDNDGDFVSDVNDPDDDNDGYADDDELTESQSDPLDADSIPLDNDGDFVSDLNDPDDDNDDVPDVSDAFPFDPTESVDADKDGIGDNADHDDDNDGYLDDDELTDDQSDPLDADSTPPDNDGDFVSDLNDYDDDNDGVPDVSDAFPFDPTESADADGDGIGDNADGDDDNDGYLDDDELTGGQSDPLDADSTPPDNDGDLISDLNDPDDDNDEMPDIWENEHGLNSFVADETQDKDGDGQSNLAEYKAGTDPSDPDSVFQFAELSVEGGQCHLTWSSVPGKRYIVWASYDMVQWRCAVSDAIEAGQGNTTSWDIPNALGISQRYFKVENLP